MVVSRLHTLYAVKVKTASGADFLLDQVIDFAVDPGIRELMHRVNGEVDPAFVAIGSQTPSMRLTTTGLVPAFAAGALTIDGLKIDSDVSNEGLEAWFQKMAEGGVRAAGSSHLKMTVNEGLLVPRMIRAEHNGVARLEAEVIISYDGTNDPIVLADSSALLGTPSAVELFTAGPVVLNGTTLEGIRSIEIDFGIQVVARGGSGEVWPTFVAIQSRQPSITIRTSDVVSLATLGLTGDAQGATDSLVYLRKLDANGARVANGTAEHIQIGIDDGIIVPLDASANSDDPAAAGVRITPIFDGVNDIFTISTAATIS